LNPLGFWQALGVPPPHCQVSQIENFMHIWCL